MGNCCGTPATVPSSASPSVQVAQPPPPTYPPPTSLSGSPPPLVVVLPPEGSSQSPAHQTARHQGERPSPRPSAVSPERVRSQTSQRRGDSMGYTPSPTGDMLAMPRAHRPEMVSHQYPPPTSRRAPSRLVKSSSMDAASLLGARSNSSIEMTRTTSTSNLPNTYLPASPQFEPQLLAPGPRTHKRQGSRPDFPSALQNLLSNDFRFRILVVGRRESGKSSLINAVFNADMSGAPKNPPGRTAEFRPRDNRHLMVHECSGSGPGELQAIRDFVTMWSHKSRPPPERLHAIWICAPVSDAINGKFDESVKMLLGLGVPVVLVFTKFDVVSPNDSSNIARRNYESAWAAASTKCDEFRRSPSGNVRAEIVSTQPRFRKFIDTLVATTDEVLIAHSRNTPASSERERTQSRVFPVTLAWSVAQRASRDINIQAAIEVGRNRYWHGLGSSEYFAGRSLESCVEVIHKDIVGVWNLLDNDKVLSRDAFKDDISYLVQDLSALSRSQPNNTSGMRAAWLSSRYENSNENICLVVGYIVDLTLILCSVFGSPGNVSSSNVQSVKNKFAGSGLKMNIHAEIRRFIETVPKFRYHENDVVLVKITDLIKQNCDLPGCE